MKFKVAGVVAESIVDGPGLRLAVFFQGCPHRCPCCHNPQTWDTLGGMEMDTGYIEEQLANDPLLTGLTLTGGEPFLQPLALMEMAEYAKHLKMDVWCYTGYTWEDLIGGVTREEILRRIDVLVDGPFKVEQKTLDMPWRGSANQRLIDVKASLRDKKTVLWKENSEWQPRKLQDATRR